MNSGLTVFDIVSLASILGVSRASAAVIMQRLKKKEILLPIQRNKYILKDRSLQDTLKIANELVKPSYISLYSSLNYFGICTQNPVDIQSVTTKRGRSIGHKAISFNFIYYKIQEKLYFGYQIIERKFIAEPEKALLDIMYLQKRGFDSESINFKTFDLKKLRQYIERYPRYYQVIFNNLIAYAFRSNLT